MAEQPQFTLNGRFQASWESLRQYKVPTWYEDAKFGIFIHWGVYAAPAFRNEWYPRNMYIKGTPEFKHHVETYGPHTQFGYKDFIPHFKAEHFDPDQWAEVFKRSGARYVMPVAEHHDGFAMYASDLSRWTAARMGPQRDIVGDLAAAVRRTGLVFGVSSHRAEHWFFMNGGKKFPSDVQDPQFADFYGPAMPGRGQDEDRDPWYSPEWQPRPDTAYLEDWLARCCELVDKYRPQVFWFDGWIIQKAFEPYLQRFAAYYYNRGDEWNCGVAINYKDRAFPEGTAVYDIERGQLAGIRPLFWQTDTSVSKNSWGYIRDGQEYKTTSSVIGDLVDIVSKNGSLLLNIGPQPDGLIPTPEVDILLGIGDWLKVNGEAIYGSRPWKVYGEGPTEVREGGFTDMVRGAFTGQDIRFTTRGDTLYAIVLAWPGARCVIRSLGTAALWDGEIGDIRLLGHEGQLTFSRTAESLGVNMPAAKPCDHAFVLKITR